MSDVVHQLVEHGQASSGPATFMLVARCGYAETRRAKDPMPARFSAWGSDVTCDGCLGRTPPQQAALLD